jgi:4-hydroxy-3-polyprenylbenzoate decarboxylase
VLKERRPLVLSVRETPLHAVHLRNLLTLTELGAVIAPPVPAFYSLPKTLDDVVDQTVLRLLDQVGLHLDAETRWEGLPRATGDD